MGTDEGILGMPENESSLRCPECDTKVSWDGTQFVCRSCPWTEHKEKPPSDRKIELPDEVRRKEQTDPT